MLLLVTRGYSKRAMEKYFSIESVREQFINNAQKIKDQGVRCFIKKFRNKKPTIE